MITITRAGDLTALRHLEASDIERIARWQPYPTRLLDSTRLQLHSDEEWERWHSRAQASDRVHAFAIDNAEGELVGFASLDADAELSGPSAPAGQSARLLIQVDAAYARLGYGYDALATLLDNALPQTSMLAVPGAFNLQVCECRVPAYNLVAIRFLNSFGFVSGEPKWIEEPQGRALLDDPEIRSYQRFLRIPTANRVEVQIHILELKRMGWLSKRDTILKRRKERAQARQQAQPTE